MSHNIICILALMTLSVCLNVWILSSIYRRTSNKDSEEPRQEKSTQLFPDAISIQELDKVMQSRKDTLGQMCISGDRLSHLYALPPEQRQAVSQQLRSAAYFQDCAIATYRVRCYGDAAYFAGLAAEKLQLAFDKLYSKKG